MKKAIVLSLLFFGMAAAKCHAGQVSVVTTTETITMVSVSTEAATLMDSDAPKDRALIIIQNQSADDFVCAVSSIAVATITTGYIVGKTTDTTTNVSNTWLRNVRRSAGNGALFKTYCQSKGTGDFGTAAVYQGGGL